MVHALTHRSWCAEHPGDESNERLEFLGDAVLGVVVTDHLFSAFPDLPEGQLAKAEQMDAMWASKLGLKRYDDGLLQELLEFRAGSAQ